MNDTVLFSIQPKWVYLIVLGKKIIEVRKTIPKLKPPFKCYIYCTHDNKFPIILEGNEYINKKSINSTFDLHGKVVGEFICDCIDIYNYDDYNYHKYDIDDDSLNNAQLTDEQLWEYGKGQTLYGIHITNLKLYSTPLPLYYLHKECPIFTNKQVGSKCNNCELYQKDELLNSYGCELMGQLPIIRPPQAWCYVKELVT